MIHDQRYGVKGQYVLRKYSLARNTEEILGPFDNLITNIGLDRLGQGGLGATPYIYVGTGTATPSNGDTSMSSFRNSVAGVYGANTYAGAPTYRARTSVVASFGEGAASGNLTEVGIGWNISPTNAIFSRALIVDSEGNPTTVTVLSDEYLEVIYLFDVYPPLTDSIADGVVISGNSYDTITRACLVGSIDAATVLRQGFTVYNGIAYTGTISTITGAPGGTNSATTDVFASAYSAGSYYRDMNYRWGLSIGNIGGVRSVRWTVARGSTSGTDFQTQFTPAIPKTDEDILTLVFRVSWGRYTP